MEDKSKHNLPQPTRRTSFIEWNPEYATRNSIPHVGDPLFSVWLEEQNGDRDVRDVFFEYTEGPVPSREAIEPVDNSDFVRRLIYSQNPTPDFLIALIMTISCSGKEALREAICHHMAREYAIKVEPGRFQTFRLMLSLPYLMLREKPIQSSQSLDLESQEKLTAYDLSFLVDPAATKNPTRFVIKEAHETVAIFGRKDHNWTGYAFSAPHMDMESETDNGDEDECDEEMPNVDLFVSGRSDEVIDPNITIYDPRTYFLRTFEIRIKVIQKEYGWLVKELQNLTTCWMKSKVYTFGVSALLHDQDQRTSLKQTLEDLVNLKGVLQDVRSHLADTLLAWRDFSKDDGHISVFSDMTAEDANKALEGIKHSFAQLGLLEQKLGQLHRQCIDSADVLTLRMESENYLLGRHMHELNFRTTELAGKTTQIALRSQQIAEETNRTTRTNVQLLMITTPFAFALQYFCGDSNFFSIERTPKAFVISLVVLFLALPIVNVSVDALHQGRKALLQWVATKLGRKGGPADDEQLDPKSLDTDFTEVV
ncbi:predicted protein [Pyrenophora tritici-repentis Pt-1C-BFP]|uniref:CorA, Mg2+ and Co2+ transporter n=1 Tax=Pyrenophora tritici-repentis (strain Pt-1C-BFP) TaxID=426418 RepID=B2VZQ1_PYRTR|nr:uncharacterized protein PTRG_02891 [Pyrenophora tritici-repentis Pt-1C-BFP]EDU45414.1 predicted protein [Pyrenophora tritici-repentis Pt-1C-BFP]